MLVLRLAFGSLFSISFVACVRAMICASGKRAPYIVVFIGKICPLFCYFQKHLNKIMAAQKLSRTSSNSVHNTQHLRPQQIPNTKYQTKFLPPHHASNVTIKKHGGCMRECLHVDPAKVKYCFEQGFSLGLSLNDCGYRFVAKSK